MDSALKLTTDYLTTRKQFGMTLNRFQALTFRAADMYTSLELTRSIVTWATMVLADPDADAEQKREAASRAKLQVSKAGRHIGQEAIQLHGGIGMTAEYAVGHLTARLTAIDHLLGDGRQQVKNLSRRLTSLRRGRAAALTGGGSRLALPTESSGVSLTYPSGSPSSCSPRASPRSTRTPTQATTASAPASPSCSCSSASRRAGACGTASAAARHGCA